ncbi:MAG: hypothetical protein WCW56_00300 [Candidatus Paceibacterota bacterium]|jgi:hypothetical protein
MKKGDAFDMARKMNTGDSLDVTAEAPVAEKNNEQALDELMDTPGFAEFLAKHPEAGELSEAENLDRVGNLHEAFGKVKETNKELNSFFKDQAKDLGLELSEDELKFVGEHIENLAINNPEEMAGLTETIKTYRETPAKIKAQTAELSKHMETFNNYGDLVVEKAKLEGYANLTKFEKGKVMGWIGAVELFFADNNTVRGTVPNKDDKMAAFVHRAALNKETINEIRDKYGLKPEQIKERIEKIEADIEQARGAMGKMDQLQEGLTSAKGKMMAENVLPLGQVRELLQQKLSEKMAGAALKEGSPDDRLKELSKVQEYFDQMANSDLDLSAGFDSGDFQKRVDDLMELQVTDGISKALESAKTDTLTNFEKGFKKYLDGLEKLGTKDKEEAQRFVVEQMFEKIGELNKSTEKSDKAKAILLRRVVAKIQANKI